jgi:hypothetical protein
VNAPLSRPPGHAMMLRMNKTKHLSPTAPRGHESQDDRSRTWAGKTASRKVRNEARHLVTLEHHATVKRSYQATAAKTSAR